MAVLLLRFLQSQSRRYSVGTKGLSNMLCNERCWPLLSSVQFEWSVSEENLETLEANAGFSSLPELYYWGTECQKIHMHLFHTVTTLTKKLCFKNSTAIFHKKYVIT